MNYHDIDIDIDIDISPSTKDIPQQKRLFLFPPVRWRGNVTNDTLIPLIADDCRVSRSNNHT